MMIRLFVLFIIYIFFISISLVSGYAISLIYPPISNIITGILLLISSVSILIIFVFDTGENNVSAK